MLCIFGEFVEGQGGGERGGRVVCVGGSAIVSSFRLPPFPCSLSLCLPHKISDLPPRESGTRVDRRRDGGGRGGDGQGINDEGDGAFFLLFFRFKRKDA